MKPFFVLLLTLFAGSGLAARASTVDERRLCVNQLCGNNDHLMRIDGGGSLETNRSPEALALIEKLTPYMKQILANNAERFFATTRLIGDADTLLAPERVNVNDKVLLGLAVYSSLPWDKVQSASRMTPEGKVWDRVKLRALWPQLSEEEVNWVAGVDEALPKAGYFNIANFARGRSVENLLSMLDVQPDKYVEFVDSLVDVASQVREWFGPIFIPDRFVDAIKKGRDKEAMTASDQILFVEAAATVIRWNELSAGSMRPIFAASPFPVNKVTNLILKKWVKYQKAITGPGEMEKLQKQILDQCTGKITARFNTAPTPDQLAKFKETKAMVVAAASESLPVYLTGAPLRMAKTALSVVKFLDPPIQQNVSESMLHAFQMEVRDSHLTNSMSDKNKLIRFLLTIAIQAEDDPIMDIPFSSLSRTCDEFAPPAILDAFSNGKITLGWQVVKWPEYGVGLMAHEIGHLVHRAIELRHDLPAILTCQANQHKTMYLAGAVPEEQTQEEDFADTFSVTVQKQLQKSWPRTRNFACLFVDMDHTKKNVQERFVDLSSDSDESHSKSYFRLLLQQIGRGQALPPACLGLTELKNKTLNSCSK